MDKEEAKFILSACRPGDQDAEDSQFQEALELARTDEELGAWLEREKALDTAISAQLLKSPVPEDLRDSLLAGHRLVRVPFRKRRAGILAAAAAVVLLLASGAAWLRIQQGFTGYRSAMVQTLEQLDSLDMRSDEVREIRAWLTERHGHADFQIPESISKLSGLGCRILEWRGHKVTLICFKDSESKLHDVVHLLVLDRDALPNPPEAPTPRYAQVGNLATAGWSDRNHTYVLAGHGKSDNLKKFF